MAVMTWSFERVAGPFAFTEGPAWDGNGLLFTDMPNDRILRYDPDTDDCTEHLTGTNGANGIKFGPDGHLYACEGAARRVTRYDTEGETTVIADGYDGHRLNSPNDLAFDADGRLWFTDPYYDDDPDSLELGHRSVYRATPDDDRGDDGWELDRMTHDTTNPNGLLVSPDGQRLHVAELRYGTDEDRELRSYRIRDDGSLGEYDVLHNFYPHRAIDGIALDGEGNIVGAAGSVESGPGPMLYVFARNGRVLETHPFPGDQPTNCTFGGADDATLYVTGDGCLYRAETDRAGYLTAP